MIGESKELITRNKALVEEYKRNFAEYRLDNEKEKELLNILIGDNAVQITENQRKIEGTPQLY